MKNNKERFKKKGQSILGSRPNSMRDFLEDQQDAQMHKDAITQSHKATESQRRNYANAQNRNYTQNPNEPNQDTGPEELERIHVQIRKDLADKLIEIVYVQKREGKKATQRRIIEQALKEYFAK
jgi:hypothetical protein